MSGKTDADIADRRLEELLEMIKMKDEKGVKSIFSKKALDNANNFDQQLNALMSFFHGDVLSWERNGGPFVHETKDHDLLTKEASTWYKVNTTEQNYLFIFIECLKNTEQPNEVGLYTLRVIHPEDEQTQFASWEAVKIPGIYTPPNN